MKQGFHFSAEAGVMVDTVGRKTIYISCLTHHMIPLNFNIPSKPFPHVLQDGLVYCRSCQSMPPSTLNLKQRLAALSLAPSSPTSPYGPDTPRSPPPTPRRRTLFNPPWSKRQNDTTMAGGEPGESELVQEVMTKMIFQAGVDFEYVHCRLPHVQT